MATIIEQVSTGNQYVLLGTGFGAFQSKKPNWFLGNLQADTTEGQYAMVCVCDAAGTIGWLSSGDARVIAVDGVPIGEAFTTT